MTLWNSSSSTVQEEPPQMRAPPPLMRDHPSWPVEEQFYVYFGSIWYFSIIHAVRSGEKDDEEILLNTLKYPKIP